MGGYAFVSAPCPATFLLHFKMQQYSWPDTTVMSTIKKLEFSLTGLRPVQHTGIWNSFQCCFISQQSNGFMSKAHSWSNLGLRLPDSLSSTIDYFYGPEQVRCFKKTPKNFIHREVVRLHVCEMFRYYSKKPQWRLKETYCHIFAALNSCLTPRPSHKWFHRQFYTCQDFNHPASDISGELGSSRRPTVTPRSYFCYKESQSTELFLLGCGVTCRNPHFFWKDEVCHSTEVLYLWTVTLFRCYAES